MKKGLCIALSLILMFTAVESVFAINVIVNSSYLDFPDQEPVIENGTTLIPIRAVAEALGFVVTWDGESKKATLAKDYYSIELTIGSTVAKTSNGEKTLSAAPKIINGRTMVPLRFIAEEIGLTVLWNDEYKRVIINGTIDTSKSAVEVDGNKTDNDEALPEERAGRTEADKTQSEGEEIEEGAGEGAMSIVSAQSSTLFFEIPDSFSYDDTGSEDSFAYRSIDALDIQHLYNWDIVTFYESYASSDLGSGIVVITEEYAPYEGGYVDVSRINEEPPERPQNPGINIWLTIFRLQKIVIERIFEDRGVEIPDNIDDMSTEEVAELLGYDSPEDLTSDVEAYFEGLDPDEVPEYAEFLEYTEWQQADAEYSAQVRELNNLKANAMRNFSSLASEASDDEWAAFFSARLNTDPEVRYEGVEILTINDKKVVHCTAYAEDPDDEQGTYDFYLYYDGDTRVTIFGGTLYSSEPSQEAVEALSQMMIQ